MEEALCSDGGLWVETATEKLLMLSFIKLGRKRKEQFEVLTAVTVRSTIISNVTPRSPIEVHQHLAGTCCLHLQGCAHLNRFSELWVLKPERLCWQYFFCTGKIKLGTKDFVVKMSCSKGRIKLRENPLFCCQNAVFEEQCCGESTAFNPFHATHKISCVELLTHLD
jgi:hypothetical protein